MSGDEALMVNRVLEHYDLGSLSHMERNTRGFVNTAFAIRTVKQGITHEYFLRRYRPDIHEEELRFEHSLIEHLSHVGTCPVARLHRTRAGTTYLRLQEVDGDPQGSFYAIFDLLSGEDRYTWDAPHCSRQEIVASAVTLADFHHATEGFIPEGSRVEPKIRELLPAIKAHWLAGPRRFKGTAFDEFVMASLDDVRGTIERAQASLGSQEARALPEIVIHCDFHPGNLKFEGDRVTGLFDFDWSKKDWRAFDLALAAWYFCASWEAGDDGRLRLEDAYSFLSAYARTMDGSGGIGKLTSSESSLFPDLIQAANLYVLNWTIEDYYSKTVDVAEYLRYLRHSVLCARWLDTPHARQQLRELMASPS